MRGKKSRPFDWLSYLFDKESGDSRTAGGGEIGADAGDGAKAPDTADSAKRRGRKKRRGIDDEDPVSFRTATEPITAQQAVYYVLRDFFYAAGPMFAYILITIACVIVGYPLVGMGGGTFAEYIGERSNPLVAIGVVLTFRRMYRRSKKAGSTFFEDASLYYKSASLKKIGMSLAFGAGVALFLSAVLTLIPRVWVFAAYDDHVQRIYQRYDIVLTIIESAVLTPLVEEIIFRGYMLNRLLRRWADLPALVVTTAVFAVMHGTSVWILYAFAMGWIIGRLSIREGNILYGIFVHAGFNLPSVVQWFYYLAYPAKQAQASVTNVFQTILIGAAGAVAAALVFVLYRRLGESAEKAEEAS